jgi:hypothetical protein
MIQSLITPDRAVDYSIKAFGPIIVALAFVIGVGGVVAAAILLCGWRGTKSIGFNWSQKRVEILCR